MTREKMAEELFQAGKEVKRSFLGVAEASRTGGTIDGAFYLQCVQILKNLNVLYQAIETGEESFDRLIEDLSERAADLFDLDGEEAFVSAFVSVLDRMLMHTVRFRQRYCLIRRNDAVPGLASHIITNLGQIVASLDSGYIPVIDTIQADNILTDLSRQYAVNAWELYFGQPFIPISEVMADGKEVRILDGIPGFMPSYDMDCLKNPELMSFWRGIMKEYMPVSAALFDSVRKCLEKLPFGNGEKILGVLCRGTDYTNIRPYNHPVQPPLKSILEKADEFMRLYGCDYCYLATEDEKILQAFQNRFKGRLLTTQEIYYESDLKDTINDANSRRSIDLHQKNMEYLTALIVLSKCRYFIGGRTSGTVVSLLFSKGFEAEYIWDCGRYGIDDALTLKSYIC
ncbi:MAG: hypothetical protein K2H52_13540 [Lachnospiraceae bacterium]|nr:hypothetical protein [Lachnospiraceae bacterium]